MSLSRLKELLGVGGERAGATASLFCFCFPLPVALKHDRSFSLQGGPCSSLGAGLGSVCRRGATEGFKCKWPGLYCQLYKISNHLEKKSLGLSVRLFLGWNHQGGKTHPKCGWVGS